MFINKNMTKIFLKIRKCSFSLSYKYTYIFLWLKNMLLTYDCKSRIIFFAVGNFWQIYRAAAAAVKGNFQPFYKFRELINRGQRSRTSEIAEDKSMNKSSKNSEITVVRINPWMQDRWDSYPSRDHGGEEMQTRGRAAD